MLLIICATNAFAKNKKNDYVTTKFVIDRLGWPDLWLGKKVEWKIELKELLNTRSLADRVFLDAIFKIPFPSRYLKG